MSIYINSVCLCIVCCQRKRDIWLKNIAWIIAIEHLMTLSNSVKYRDYNAFAKCFLLFVHTCILFFIIWNMFHNKTPFNWMVQIVYIWHGNSCSTVWELLPNGNRTTENKYYFHLKPEWGIMPCNHIASLFINGWIFEKWNQLLIVGKTLASLYFRHV